MKKQLTLDNIVGDIVQELKKSKEKFVLVDNFPSFLTKLINEKYGKFTYKSEIGIAVKNKLKEHKDIVVYKPSNDVFDSNGAYAITVGEYFAIRGAYKDVVDMKEKNKIVPMFFKTREEALAWEKGELAEEFYNI